MREIKFLGTFQKEGVSRSGRYLKENEVVHHINENKLDNRPENLEVMTASEHIKLHANKRWRGRDGKFAI